MKLLGQGHSSEKVAASNSKTTGRKLLELDRNICFDNVRSNSMTLTFDLETFSYFLNSSFKF